MKTLTKKSALTFVELPPTLFGVLNSSISYDIFSKFKLPSRGIPSLIGVLKADGWKNITEINPMYHGARGKLTEENFKTIFRSDVLLISSITRTSPQSMKLADLYKMNNPKGIVIAGGPDPTFRSDEWLRHVDIVVKGEGEKTLKELMEELTKDNPDLSLVNGAAFKKGEAIIVNAPRELMDNEELGNLPPPYYDNKIKRGVMTAVIETSRGCPHDCEFCSVTQFYGRKYRVKSVKSVLNQVKAIKGMNGQACFFVDDNFVGLPNRAISLLKSIRSSLADKIKFAQVTIATAFNEKLLKALKEAGFMHLCVGIESIIDETLKYYGKPYTADKNKEAVKIFRENGFWVHGMMMIGGDGDTPETLDITEEWACKSLDSVQFFTPMPLPGTRFYQQMEQEGRILTKDWSLYDGQHVVIKPKNFTPYDLQKRLFDMYKGFYSLKNGVMRNFGNQKMKLSLIFSSYALFGGISRIFNNPQTKSHLEFLRSLE